MSDFSDCDFSDDDLAGEDTKKTSNYLPNLILIAIDCHPSMFIKSETFTHFQTAINACYLLADSLLLTSPSRYNQFAIQLACDDASKSCLVPFNNNILETIKTLEKLKDTDDSELAQQFERKADPDLSDLFLTCLRQFNTMKDSYYKKILIFVTNDDNPCKGSPERKYTALNAVQQLNEHKITLDLVTFNVDFAFELFYSEVYSLLKELTPEHTIVEDLDGLEYKLSIPVANRMTSFKTYIFPASGNEELTPIRVVEEAPIRNAAFYCNSYRSEEGSELVKKTDMFTEEGDIVNKNVTYELEGSPPIKFAKEDVEQCKQTEHKIGYTIAGAISKPSFNELVFPTAPTFLKNGAAETKGEFEALWRRCKANNERLLCVKKRRKNIWQSYVELVPLYMGDEFAFVVRHIPSIDKYESGENVDLEALHGKELEEEESEEVERVLAEVIKSLRIDYEPGMFSDPELGMHRNYLKAKFLDRQVEEFSDDTLDLDVIDRMLSGIEVNSALWAEEEAKKRKKADPKPAAAKRSRN